MAREYSKGPAAPDGGDLGYIATDELSPQIEAATRGLKPGEVTDLIKTPAGYFILKVMDIQREKQAKASIQMHAKKRSGSFFR